MKEYYKNIPSEFQTDFESFYQRMADELPDDSVIVEVGISNGRSGIMLAEMLTGQNKKFTLYLIDNFAYGSANQRNDVMNHIIKSGFGENINMMDMSSLDAACEFPDNHFNFVFLDSSHRYEQTKAEVLIWSRKVKHDGIISGHDYFSMENPEVRLAVDEIIPKRITRHSIPDQQDFEPEDVLQTEETRNGAGVWFFRKKWYYTLK